MGFETKKVAGQGVERWSSLINSVVSRDSDGAKSVDPLFYNFAPRDEFTRGAEDKYGKLVGGRTAVAGPAEIAPPFKGLSRFKR